MVTVVRYEVVESSQAQDKITELSRLVQEVSVVKQGCILINNVCE